MIFIDITKIIGLIVSFVVIGTRTFVIILYILCINQDVEQKFEEFEKNGTYQHYDVCFSDDHALHFAYCALLAASIAMTCLFIAGLITRRSVFLIPLIMYEVLMSVLLTVGCVLYAHYDDKESMHNKSYIWTISASNTAFSGILLSIFLILRYEKGNILIPSTSPRVSYGV